MTEPLPTHVETYLRATIVPTKPIRHKPIRSAVRAINEAAGRAKDAGLTFDEFVASAVWAAGPEMNDLPIPYPAFTAALIDANLARNEWHVVEEKMAEEAAS